MKRLLLITALITSFASLSYAKPLKQVVTDKAFNVQPNDGGAPFLVVTGQILDLESCKEEACIVKHKGETFSLPRLDLRSILSKKRLEQRVRAYNRTPPTIQIQQDELAGSTTSRTSTQASRGQAVNSSGFHSCYNRHKSTYTRIKWCGSAKNRHQCGKKSSYRSAGLCYKGVKHLLLKCGAVGNYLSGGEAKKSGDQLMAQGFKKLSTKDPRKAPPGSVVVYDNGGCAGFRTEGHIEIKVSETEWVSDFIASRPIVEKTPNCRPVKAIYFQ